MAYRSGRRRICGAPRVSRHEMHFLLTYFRAMAVLRRNQGIALALIGANVLVAGLQFLDPILFGRVIGVLSSSAPGSNRMALWGQITGLLGIWAGVGVAGIGANVVSALYAERLAHRNRLALMERYFAHVLGMPVSFHGETQSGRMLKVMLSGADAMFGVWLTFFREQLATFVAVVVLLPLATLMNWRLAVSLIVLVVLFGALTALVIRRTEQGQQRAQQFQGALAGTAQDALTNVVVVQSFTRLAAEQRLFGEIAQQVINHQFPVLNWWAFVSVMTRAASTISVIVIVVIGTVLFVNGLASVAEIVSFMGLATMLIGRLDSAVAFISRLVFEVPNMDAFFAVLDAKSSVPEKPAAKPLVARAGEVVFDNVNFAYPGGPKILSNVSFTAHPGTSVALVGHTGAGKSTTVALLQRLWDPCEGRILIDGQDLREVTLESLRRTIGVVFQESMLFNRTIRENILIGKPDASQAELEAACQLADAHEFILRQPQGYDTMIGERGTTLSGGQRQRLAIARALLKDPPILILDEATSALDSATEARVGRALRNLMAGRTTFIVAHRLSTVRDANEILVFEQGRVVERGDFRTLLAEGGRFSELVATQLTPSVPLRLPEPV
ncbi:MAG TPA: glucan ABC transporter ATP-binding protein/ permease [Acetobacteraceae bacterium]|nr:glucan ABC transporter ATP-binding protein/ permease [Acetobacteraceae bacterium]